MAAALFAEPGLQSGLVLGALGQLSLHRVDGVYEDRANAKEAAAAEVRALESQGIALTAEQHAVFGGQLGGVGAAVHAAIGTRLVAGDAPLVDGAIDHQLPLRRRRHGGPLHAFERRCREL